ncbi:MAG: alpha/beta fold hydrolase [Chloroflexota bacterium]
MTLIPTSPPRASPSRAERLLNQFIQVDGLSIHARVAFPPVSHGTPVVLVHGLVVSSRYMMPTAELLAGDTRVYAPDLPGYGLSEKPPGMCSAPALAGALDRWMSALGLEPALVVANSFGCQIAAHLAATYPSRVQELVLLGPMVDPRTRNLLKLVARGLANVPLEPPSLGWIILRDLLAMGIPRALALVWAMLTDRIEETLPRVLAPTLVVRGERDPMVSGEWVEELVQRLPRGRSAVIADAGHALNYNAPGRVACLIQSLIHVPPQAVRAS